jgi:predicted permease
MGVTMRAGRDFSASDDATSRPVVIVSESLARKLWPGQDPIGRLLDPSQMGIAREVVGVVPGLRYQALEEEAGDDVYLPMRQTTDYGAVHVIVRGAQPSAALVSTVRAVLRPMDSQLALTELRTLQEIVDQAVSPRRFLVLLLGGFAAFALVLASLGIYAVVSYGVVQRRREIGIRMALGATPGNVQVGVLSRTLRLTAAGLTVGIVASWALARVMQSLLFGVTFTDPATFAAVLVALTAVAALAGYLPARRAAHLEPVEALRAE